MDNEKKDKIIKNKACFNICEQFKISCQKKECRLWLESEDSYNCTMLLASKNENGMTLQEIGKYHNLTRMRVCQIEKRILKKLKKKIKIEN